MAHHERQTIEQAVRCLRRSHLEAQATTTEQEVESEPYPQFQELLKIQEPLVQHCSFGVGGPADLWLTLQTQ